MSHYKYIAEFRYAAEPEILDNRGKIVSATLKGELEDWIITENKIDVTNKDRTKAVFIGHHRAGFALEGKSDVDELVRIVAEGMKVVPPIRYDRLGFRLTTIIDSSQNFADLKKKIEDKTMQPKLFEKPPIKSKIEDIATCYVFSFEDGCKLNVNLGPMEEKQSKTYFSQHKSIPSVGIFLDLDCFITPKRGTDIKEVKRFVHFAKQKVDVFRDYLLKVLEV